jgi:hypothetical protein
MGVEGVEVCPSGGANGDNEVCEIHLDDLI